MSSAEAVINAAEDEAPKKRPRGRPKKETPQHATIITDVTNPPRLKYYSDSASPNQRTASGLKWWNELSDPCKELIDVTIYRDWPALNDPTEEGEYKYIDKLLGTQPLKNDQDFVDRWGAGDYHAYVNVTPLGGTRRTIMMLFVKGSHDFKTYLPTDQRIDNPVENLSLTDPGNASYVGWLRSTGKITGNEPTKQEKDEMSATAEVLGKVLDQNTAVMNRMLDEKDKQIADVVNDIPPEPPSPQAVIGEQLAIFKSLKELVPTSDPMEMMRHVVATAQMLVQKDSGADMKPLMDQIDKLREESRATEREMWRSQLAEIKERLQAKENANPNVLLPDGSNLNSIVEKAVAEAVESSLGETDNSWWLGPLKAAAPIAIPAIMGGLAQMFRPAPAAAPFPMPPGNFQAGAPQQPQAQLPAPTQPQQPAPQAQQGGAYTTGSPQLDGLLMQITVPLADALRDGDTGAEFAELFITEFGHDVFTQLASSGVEPIVGVLYSYPPLTSTLKPLPREKVVRFITEFSSFVPTAETAGGAA